MNVGRLVLPATALLAMTAVTACEKPAPKITVSSSGRVVNVDATRYCRNECRNYNTRDTKTIRVRSNTEVGFDVPKRVAEKGWVLQVGDKTQFAEVRHDSHFRLSTGPIAQKQPVEVTIVEAGNGVGGKPSGVWRLQFNLQE